MTYLNYLSTLIFIPVKFLKQHAVSISVFTILMILTVWRICNEMV